MEQSLSELVQRIEKLEEDRLRALRDNRRLRSILASVLVTVMILVGVGANRQLRPDPIESGEFLIRDRHGKPRASLGLRPDGMTSLVFYDNKGKERLTIGAMPDGSPGLSLSDPNGKERLTLGSFPDGSVHLVFSDRNDKPRLSLRTGPDDIPRLSLFDDDEKSRFGLFVQRDKTVKIQVLGQDEKTGFIMGAKSNGEAVLAGCDESGKYKMALAFTKEHRGALVFMDRNGKARASLDDEGFGLVDPDGKDLVTLGRKRDSASTRFDMLGRDGKPRISAEVDADGNPSMTIIDREGKTISATPRP